MSLASAAAKLLIKPLGPVEAALFDHIWQQKPIEETLAELMRAEVFLYTQNTAEAIAGGAEPKPLVTQGGDGRPAMLVFTSEARAASIAKQLPLGSAAPLTQRFTEVLRWAPTELGLVINHGSALAAECGPEHMDALRKQAAIFRP